MHPYHKLENRRVRLIDLDLPDVFGLVPVKQKEKGPENDIYHVRNFLKFDVYDTQAQEQMKQTKAKFNAYSKKLIEE